MQRMDIYEILLMLRKRWKFLFSSILLFFSATTVVVIYVIDPTYEASEAILVGDLERGTEYAQTEQNNMLLASTMDFLRSPMVKTEVSETLAIPYQQLDEQIAIQHNERSQLINIVVHYHHQEEAKNIARSMADSTVSFMEQSLGVNELQVMNNASEVVDARRVDNPVMNIAIAFIVSLFFGVSTTFLRHQYVGVIQHPEELERELQVLLLGEVSVKKGKSKQEFQHYAAKSEVNVRGKTTSETVD
ncbi:YveK family protein [Geomicrobium sp. JSM 1781026]|uniref:YveK family protein n=1 Tax=Geomicrobium sp. JSM 1781026 TaxID=3344580 RepID=UPI0035BFF3D4